MTLMVAIQLSRTPNNYCWHRAAYVSAILSGCVDLSIYVCRPILMNYGR